MVEKGRYDEDNGKGMLSDSQERRAANFCGKTGYPVKTAKMYSAFRAFIPVHQEACEGVYLSKIL